MLTYLDKSISQFKSSLQLPKKSKAIIGDADDESDVELLLPDPTPGESDEPMPMASDSVSNRSCS